MGFAVDNDLAKVSGKEQPRMDPRLLPPPSHQSFEYVGREAGGKGDEPSSAIIVPDVWNQNTWLRVIAEPTDLG